MINGKYSTDRVTAVVYVPPLPMYDTIVWQAVASV